ncbi:hypothetical protein [Roseiconus lacunae]|uniref:Sodium/calcium exchanger membrane region domain-containing protein n=1 Tax=Roseiconus lacunae TaxID=2605694 RepID=A0ABT7PJN3_9BACT|nr:hypothetical protein [Roseiconus lacunae]MCD0459511.1 hypothetical protein [Roseiconus lacunae]MDM4016704.1 hypothetical protein [Roseiconus lacunae]WRQ50982.1 hypothetical protein U8335_00240 [Stieleria sp. HD01]
MQVLIMIVSVVAIILLVKYGLLRGIDHVSGAMNWSVKTRGQLTGFATSVPELVCLTAAGLSGVWEAGLWNIASSNIINCVLMISAVAYYRQFRGLMNRRFVDEIVFAGLAIAVPIVLMRWGMDTQWYLVPILLAFFVVYQVVDRRINPANRDDVSVEEAVGSLPVGIILGLSALIAIAVAGIFLGDATADVVKEFGVHPVIAGWILGFVTSIPEMVTFFAVYSAAKSEGKLGHLDDTQEALDNLTGSNMSNVGIVYPVGLAAFLLGSVLIGA